LLYEQSQPGFVGVEALALQKGERLRRGVGVTSIAGSLPPSSVSAVSVLMEVRSVCAFKTLPADPEAA